MQQTWDSSAYAHNGRFVAEMAGSLVEALNPQPEETILDLGCGDGFLTRRIADSGATVLAVDSSPAMVAAAQARGINARLADAEKLNFAEEFDAVFSNAALHWMRDQDTVLGNVRRALRPGGRFVAELGGHGNIAAIRVASLAVLGARGIAPERIECNSFFTVAEYPRIARAPGISGGADRLDASPYAAAHRHYRLAEHLPPGSYRRAARDGTRICGRGDCYSACADSVGSGRELDRRLRTPPVGRSQSRVSC